MKQNFIGKRGVASVVDTGRKTPMKGIMLKVCYEDGTYEYMPEKRFNIIKTEVPTNDSDVRGMLVAHTTKECGSVLYSMLLEYGCKLSEIDAITNQLIVMTNAATDRVSDILWGVDYADARTLNQINDILLENVTKNDNNAGASSGAGSTA